MGNKSILRNQILMLRDGMDTTDRQYLDGRLSKRLLSCELLQKSTTVLAYVSYKSEVDTIGIIKKLIESSKKIAVPKVIGEEMQFYFIESMDDLELGYKGIMEPKAGLEICEPSKNDVMLVPGTVFDKRLYRIGYGKGFYDRYLAKYKGLITIGLAYDFQIIDEVPVNPWDKGLKYIVSEKQIYSY